MFPQRPKRRTDNVEAMRDEHVEANHGKTQNTTTSRKPTSASKTTQTVWNHVEQPYVAKGWSTTNGGGRPNSQMGGSIVRFFRGQKRGAKQIVEESDDGEPDEEDKQLACSMSGRQCETSQFPTGIASVLPTDWCNHAHSLTTPLTGGQGVLSCRR